MGIRPEPQMLNLNGWWHLWYDEAAPIGEELSFVWCEGQIGHIPSVGWEGMDDSKESLSVPGTWAMSRPDYRGVAWYWRPIAIPDDWQDRPITVRFEAVRGHAEVYLDGALVGHSPPCGGAFEADLSGHVRAGRCFTLAVRISYTGQEGAPGLPDAGGITGDVVLIGAKNRDRA